MANCASRGSGTAGSSTGRRAIHGSGSIVGRALPTSPRSIETRRRSTWLRRLTAISTTLGDDCVDLVELAGMVGSTVIGSHEMSVWLGARGIESIGMNNGGTVEVAGVKFTMVHADHTGGATLGTGSDQVTRDLGCWGWILEFEDGTVVYQSGYTDVFGDMALIGERYGPTIGVFPIGGHYTMGPQRRGQGGGHVRCVDGHPGPLRDISRPGRHPRGAPRAHRCGRGGPGTGPNLGE